MKYLFLGPFFFLFYLSVNAQITVTKVTGRIKNKAGEIIRPGSELKTNESLFFSAEKDKLWVIEVGNGEYVISPSPKAKSEYNVISELLSSTLHLQLKSGSLSGRSQIFEKIPEAFVTDRNVNSKLVIEHENKYLFE